MDDDTFRAVDMKNANEWSFVLFSGFFFFFLSIIRFHTFNFFKILFLSFHIIFDELKPDNCFCFILFIIFAVS